MRVSRRRGGRSDSGLMSTPSKQIARRAYELFEARGRQRGQGWQTGSKPNERSSRTRRRRFRENTRAGDSRREFVAEDDLLTLEGWLHYQAIELDARSADEGGGLA